eukprot:COSAG06_NODE_5202_length_3642_cov_9.712955_1_plen_102_part_10
MKMLAAAAERMWACDLLSESPQRWVRVLESSTLEDVVAASYMLDSHRFCEQGSAKARATQSQERVGALVGDGWQAGWLASWQLGARAWAMGRESRYVERALL